MHQDLKFKAIKRNIKNAINMMRAFIAIDVGMNDKIKEIYEDISKTKAKLKMVEPENIHLTLKFLGEIKDKDVEIVKNEIIEAKKEIKPFKALLKGTGVFPSREYIKVLWIGFFDDGQTKILSEIINERLAEYGFKREKNFKPHVTIARMKSREGKEDVLKIIDYYRDRAFGEIECREIKLKESVLTSKGPIYKDLEVVRL